MFTSQKAGFSLARGFVVLTMPAIHTALFFSSPAVKEGPIGVTLGFIAETSGAPLFMFLMGLFICVSSQKNLSFVLKRSVLLVLMGYVLNAVKFLPPYFGGWIPDSFLLDNGLEPGSRVWQDLVLTGDILQFAGIAYLLCTLIKQWKLHPFIIISIWAAVLAVTPLLWQWKLLDVFPSLIKNLVAGEPPLTFFPLFPWLAYPVAGLITGKVLIQLSQRQGNLLVGFAGLFCICTGLLIMKWEPEAWQQNFYRLGPGATAFHCGVVLIWVRLFIALAEHLPSDRAFSLLHCLSRNILGTYITQWIVVTWCFSIFEYNGLNTLQSVIAILFTTVISFAGYYAFKTFHQHLFKKSKHGKSNYL